MSSGLAHGAKTTLRWLGFACAAVQHCFGGHSLILEGQPKVRAGYFRQRQDFSRTGFRLARMTVGARFHRLPRFVPDVGAATRADPFRLAVLFVQLYRGLGRVAALSLVSDWLGVPDQQ